MHGCVLAGGKLRAGDDAPGISSDGRKKISDVPKAAFVFDPENDVAGSIFFLFVYFPHARALFFLKKM